MEGCYMSMVVCVTSIALLGVCLLRQYALEEALTSGLKANISKPVTA